MNNQRGPSVQTLSGNSPLRVAIAAAVVVAAATLTHVFLNSGRELATSAVEPMRQADQHMRSLRSVPPELVKWRQTERIETGLRKPTGIALAADGTLIVGGDNSVGSVASEGQLRKQIATAQPVTCVAVDGAAVYVGTRDHVEVHSAGAAPVAWPALGPQAYITSISVLGDDVWVADAGNRIVLRCAKDGSILARVGEKNEALGIPGLLVPSPHLDVIAIKGGALIANPGRHFVETYNLNGGLESSWGVASSAIEGFCGCCNPTDIALLPDGRIVTSEKGLPRVKVYTPGGKLDAVVATPDDLSPNAKGIDILTSPDGRIYVLDPPERAVLVFSARPPDTATREKPVAQRDAALR